jgi:hypothetical protein
MLHLKMAANHRSLLIFLKRRPSASKGRKGVGGDKAPKTPSSFEVTLTPSLAEGLPKEDSFPVEDVPNKVRRGYKWIYANKTSVMGLDCPLGGLMLSPWLSI